MKTLVENLTERTCGELSCYDCNRDREDAARTITFLDRENIRLRRSLCRILFGLLAIVALFLAGCTSITYTKPDGSRFHYYSTKDVSYDKVVLDKVVIEGIAANASEVRKEHTKAVETVTEAAAKVAPLLLAP